MHRTFEETLTELVRPEVEGTGCVLWGLTAPSKGKKRIIRIYIDGEDGVSIDRCAEVSRQVGLMLEVEDVIPGAYTLEVSSPGLDRRFFSTAQMRDYVGKKVAAQVYEAVEGRRKFTGELTGCEADAFTLDVDGEPVSLAWTDVKEVRLVHEF
jgi:ribosome maturation factor RimP